LRPHPRSPQTLDKSSEYGMLREIRDKPELKALILCRTILSRFEWEREPELDLCTETPSSLRGGTGKSAFVPVVRSSTDDKFGRGPFIIVREPVLNLRSASFSSLDGGESNGLALSSIFNRSSKGGSIDRGEGFDTAEPLAWVGRDALSTDPERVLPEGRRCTIGSPDGTGTLKEPLGVGIYPDSNTVLCNWL
jgi:hypothetical protein